MKKLISSLLLSFVVCVLQAQIKDPVKFKTEFNTLSDTEAEIVFTAAIDKGWHVYSTCLLYTSLKMLLRMQVSLPVY